MILLLSGPATAAEILVNCEYLFPPLDEAEYSLTKKPISIGVAECETEKGVDITAQIYCAREDWEDATKCANAENIPVLKSLESSVAKPKANDKATETK